MTPKKLVEPNQVLGPIAPIAPIARMGFLILFAVIFSDSALAAKKLYVLCRSGEVVRTLRVCRDDGDGNFKVLYTKNGRDEVKAAGKSYDFNVTKLISIRETLESANWKCKDISPASLHIGDRSPASTQDSEYAACE